MGTKYVILFYFIIIFIYSCERKTNYDYLFTYEIENKMKSDSSQINMDLYAQEFSFVPTFDRVTKAKEILKLGLPDLNLDSLTKNYFVYQARQYIIEKAKENEIVIINEAHHFPRHRAFVSDLLADLKACGYNKIGVEALNMGKDYSDKKFMTKNDGFYIVEPTFANLIRQAIKLGFKIFPYESPNAKNSEQREIEQANNINKFLKKNPKGKTLIYCGYDHNLEGEIKYWGGKAMAARLNDLTGVNPLTVNQTVFNDVNLKSINQATPFVLVDSRENSYQYYKNNDIFVFHPLDTTSICEWKKNDLNYWLDIDFIDKESSFPVFVKVYYNQNELDGDAIPYDIVEVKSTNEHKKTLVPNTNYVIEIIDKDRVLLNTIKR